MIGAVVAAILGQGIALPLLDGVDRFPVIEQHLLAANQGLQFAGGGVCGNVRRERRLESLSVELGALAVEYQRRTGRDAPGQILFIERTCGGAYFQNVRAVEASLQAARRMMPPSRQD